MPPGAMIAREHRVACVRRRGLREVRSGRGQREGLDMPRTPAIVGQRPGRAGWATSSLGEPWALAPEQLVATERRYQARTGARAAADQAIAQGRILHADAPSGSADAWPGLAAAHTPGDRGGDRSAPSSSLVRRSRTGGRAASYWVAAQSAGYGDLDGQR